MIRIYMQRFKYKNYNTINKIFPKDWSQKVIFHHNNAFMNHTSQLNDAKNL